MFIDTESIQPYSPEHIDYFLGWLYRDTFETKQWIWDLITSEKNKRIEFDLYLFAIDHENKNICVRDLYDDGTHHCFFSRNEWLLQVSFDEFKQYIGLYEMDYTQYQRVKNYCAELLEWLTMDELTTGLDNKSTTNVKQQLKHMQWHMDLNTFVPDYHKSSLFMHSNNEVVQLLYDLALRYLDYAKPLDVIAQSKLYQSPMITRL